MILKTVIKFYLNLGNFFDCFFYRKFSIFLINFYQIFLKKIFNRRCQFKNSCSNFFKEQFNSTEKFEVLVHKLNIRIIDCSKPLNISYSTKSEIIATGLSTKKYRQHELSDLVIKNSKNIFEREIKNLEPTRTD